MFTVRTLPQFDAWLDGLTDATVQRRLVLRLRRATLGNLGDVRSVGDGVWEMREHFGAGWRMYYVRRGRQLVLMVGGGDKSTQGRDIRTAQQRAKLVIEDGQS
jgi:putative addiction module killer protein